MAYAFESKKQFTSNNNRYLPAASRQASSASTLPRFAPPPHSLLNTQNSVLLLRNRSARLRGSLSFHNFFQSLRRPADVATSAYGGSTKSTRRRYRTYVSPATPDERFDVANPRPSVAFNRFSVYGHKKESAVMDPHRDASLTSITGANINPATNNSNVRHQPEQQFPLLQKPSQTGRPAVLHGVSASVTPSLRGSVALPPHSPGAVGGANSSRLTSEAPHTFVPNDPPPHASTSFTAIESHHHSGATTPAARGTRAGSLMTNAVGAHENATGLHATPSNMATGGGLPKASKSVHNALTDEESAAQRRANPYAWMVETHRDDGKSKPRGYVFANTSATPKQPDSAAKSSTAQPAHAHVAANQPVASLADRSGSTGIPVEFLAGADEAINHAVADTYPHFQPANKIVPPPPLSPVVGGMQRGGMTPVGGSHVLMPMTTPNSVIATPSALAAAAMPSSKQRAAVVVDKMVVATTINLPAPASNSAADAIAVGGTPEVLEGLKAGQKYEGGTPNRITGLISKQRNRGKGWHKRYYVLEKGFLTYSKSKNEWERSKYHGMIDVGLSIITVHRNSSKIHIDTGESLYYFRVGKDEFDAWVQCLRDHRLYRQNEVSINFSPKTTVIPQQPHTGRQQQIVDDRGQPMSDNGLSQKNGGGLRPVSAYSGASGQTLLKADELSPAADSPMLRRDQMAKAMASIERNAGALDVASQQIMLSQDMLSRLSAMLEQIEMEQSAEPDFDDPASGRESVQQRTASNNNAGEPGGAAGGKGLLNLFGRRTKKKKSASADQKTLSEIVAQSSPGQQYPATAVHHQTPVINSLQPRSSQLQLHGSSHHAPVSSPFVTIDGPSSTKMPFAGSQNIPNISNSAAAHNADNSAAARIAHAGQPLIVGIDAVRSNLSPNINNLPGPSSSPLGGAISSAATMAATIVTASSLTPTLHANMSNHNLTSLSPTIVHHLPQPSPLQMRPLLTVSDSMTTNNNGVWPAASSMMGSAAPSASAAAAIAANVVNSTMLTITEQSLKGATPGGYSVPPSPAPSDTSQLNNNHMNDVSSMYRNYIIMAQMLTRTLAETHGLLKAETNRLKQQQGFLFVGGSAAGGGGGVNGVDAASIATLPASLLGASTRGSMSRIVTQLVRQNRDLRSKLAGFNYTITDSSTLRNDTLRADRFPHDLLAQSMSAGSTGSADLFFDALEGFDEDIMSENDSESSSEKSGDHESIDSELDSDAEAAAAGAGTAAAAIAAGADHVASTMRDSRGGVITPLVARTSSVTARLVAEGADVTLGAAGGPLASAVAGNNNNNMLSVQPSSTMEPEESLTMFHARRTKLPSPRQDAGVSLWSVLRKAIGKDLSKISLPVSLNEPLGVLQRLCEELEYCDLLDRAAEHADPLDRITYVAAFSVSGFASGYYRSGSKPFNPLLGETYECKREDKGFQFVAEQVSHHPPVSSCFATSKQYTFWQDCRIKTKFWGRSMEVSASGTVSCELTKHRETYTWGKPSSTVLNIFSNKRSIELNGEIILTSSSGLRCKLQYTKGGSGSGHEVVGEITNVDGRLVRYVYGKWNEGLYYSEPQPSTNAKNKTFVSNPATAKELWRPGVMPEDHELYYGFSQFAIELNELQDGMEKLLPITDTRFRPDQRLLECGHLDSAEEEKNRLEATQRERRLQMEAEGRHWEPKWFNKLAGAEGEESYEFNHRYWRMRESPGFRKIDLPALW